MQEDYDAIRANMDVPLPGQSLTRDPNNPAPFEQAPKFTTAEQASKYLWDFVTDDTHYSALMQGVNKGVPVMDYVKVILFNEFVKGTFNPDLMMIMAEPLAFMIIALAERLNLDIKITNEDDEDEDEEMFGVKVEEEKLARLRKSIPQGIITKNMEDEMRTLPDIDSLLAQQTPESVENNGDTPTENIVEDTAEQPATQEPSLMSPPEQEVQA